LQDVQQEIQQGDLDKLIDVLQKDTVSPQLELLQERLDQQIQMQVVCNEVLQRISGLLQEVPTSSTLKAWYTSSQQQQYAWQKELSHRLQDIQVKNSEQVLRLGNLYRQDQYTQERILVSLRNVTFLLEQMLVRPPLPNYRENGSLFKREPITAPVSASRSALSTDQLPLSISTMPIGRGPQQYRGSERSRAV
jgi:hypothetical protein